VLVGLLCKQGFGCRNAGMFTKKQKINKTRSIMLDVGLGVREGERGRERETLLGDSIYHGGSWARSGRESQQNKKTCTHETMHSHKKGLVRGAY
jgi:hypothetical protein